jgi:hypothetical protein
LGPGPRFYFSFALQGRSAVSNFFGVEHLLGPSGAGVTAGGFRDMFFEAAFYVGRDAGVDTAIITL